MQSFWNIFHRYTYKVHHIRTFHIEVLRILILTQTPIRRVRVKILPICFLYLKLTKLSFNSVTDSNSDRHHNRSIFVYDIDTILRFILNKISTINLLLPNKRLLTKLNTCVSQSFFHHSHRTTMHIRTHVLKEVFPNSTIKMINHCWAVPPQDS